MMRSTIFVVAACAAAVLQPAYAQETVVSDAARQTADRLIDQALEANVAYDVVESLTTEVGPRLGGTEAEARARQWAVAKLDQLGFENIRIEPFETRLWTRGAESARIVSPFPQELHVTTLGHSVATPEGGVTAEIVRFETLEDLREAPADSLRGRIAFVDEMMTRTQDGSGYGVAVKKRSDAAVEAGRRGALAALIRSVGTDHHRFPHTGAMRYDAEVPFVPIAALSAPDADQLTRALARGPVRVHLELDSGGGGRVGDVWDSDPSQMAPSGNVIAEIPGQTDEIVLLGAHLDSWDLGTGAIDDGAGVGIVIAAARLIGDLRGKPKRTIRVVLFGAEEIGLAGAYAYAREHADDLDKHVIAAESDFGAREIWRMQTRWGDDKLPKADIFFRALRRLGVGPGDNAAYGGPDLKYLREAGVPVVTLAQNGWDYFDLHHTADDTFDKIDPEELTQNVAVYAAFAWLASEMEGDFRAAEETLPSE